MSSQLRKARIDDNWRRLFKRNYDVCINAVSLEGEHVFSKLQTDFTKGLSCIVGKNGLGKSNFIRTIYNAFCTSESNREKFDIKIINEGVASFDIKSPNGNRNYRVQVGSQIEQPAENTITSFLFDPCNTIPTLQEMLIGQDNFEEFLEGFNEQILGQDEVEIINYLTGNLYEEVKLIIIEDEYDAFSSFPFFSVKRKLLEYDVRTMGLGEFSLFYFYWLVNYVKRYENGKILLIEEPESFLPPSSQERFTNILAKSLSEEGMTCILSSHSEHILKRIPRENILVFQKQENYVICRHANHEFEHLKVIGLSAPKLGMLLFEDSAAILFFKSIIKKSIEFVIDSFYYHSSGSEGDIATDLKRIPSKINTFRVIGVFDGDCRGKDFQLSEESLTIHLPSKLAPEQLLINQIQITEISILASLFNKTNEEVAFAIEGVVGLDHHDYFEELSKLLELNFEFVFSTICDLWINHEENLETIKEFLTEFKEKME